MGAPQVHYNRQPSGEIWLEGPVSPSQTEQYASVLDITPVERATVAKNLLEMPTELKIRGLFFDGVTQVIAHSRDLETARRIRRFAGLPPEMSAFGQYTVRDFYKLYYLAAATLAPRRPFPEAIRTCTRTFFGIFQESLIGKTVTAFMGRTPDTTIPIVCRAYNLSVEGEEMRCEHTGPNEITWYARSAPVTWYPDSLQGIIEGGLPKGYAIEMRTLEKRQDGRLHRYTFRIRW